MKKQTTWHGAANPETWVAATMQAAVNAHATARDGQIEKTTA